MEIIIRPVKVEDAEALNAIRTHADTMEQLYGIPTERIEANEAFLRSLKDSDHMVVAEASIKGKPKVVGAVSLHLNAHQRSRHCAHVGIMVHHDYQGKGVGRKLMDYILDLADNWLMLVRVDLNVLADNKRAIKLYESCGFVKEGVKKYIIIKNGKYADLILMARYRI